MRHAKNWMTNKIRAMTNTKLPTRTDQAGARETDVNVIVKNFTVHGQLPKGSAEPMYADFTLLPKDLRGFIDMGRGLKDTAAQLPDALKSIPLEQLIGMSDQDLAARLKPAKPPAPTPTENTQ